MGGKKLGGGERGKSCCSGGWGVVVSVRRFSGRTYSRRMRGEAWLCQLKGAWKLVISDLEDLSVLLRVSSVYFNPGWRGLRYAGPPAIPLCES